MADDITFQTTAATPPSGTVVATDDVGGKHFQRVKIDLGGDGLSSPLERGAQTAANSLPVTTATDDPLVSQIGATNETAPGTDTAVSGLNGRLQRIAQRLTSLIGLLPAALTVSGNLKTAVLEALPAGTNNIGDVDVLSVVPGTAATNLGKAEDAVHANGDTGVMALAVRKDTAAALAGTDGDYAPLEVDANGRLHVNGSGVTQPVSVAAGATNIAKAEDAASADADVGVPAMAVRKASPANTSGADGDYEMLQMSAGHLWVAPPVLTKPTAASFNRPADTTAYAANDAVADNTTAGSVTKLQWSIPRGAGIIRRVRIRKSDQTVATPTLRLWLWDATFTVAAGDNAAFSNPLQDAIGYVDVAVTSAGTDDAVGWTNCDIPFSASTLFGLLQTLSAFTPASGETFTVDFWYLPG